MKDVLDWIKGRVTDTVKPNLADYSYYNWGGFVITSANSTPYQLNTWVTTEDLTTNDYLNISYDFKSYNLVKDNSVSDYASIIGLNTSGKQVMALNVQSQMYPNSSGLVSINAKVTQEMIDSGKIKLVAYYLGYSSGTIAYRRIKAEKGQIATPYIQSANDLETARKDIALNKTDISNLKRLASSTIDGLMSKTLFDKLNNLDMSKYYTALQTDAKIKVVADAEILDRQDINTLNEAITGEDALIDANNTKFAQLLGVDIATIKGGIV